MKTRKAADNPLAQARDEWMEQAQQAMDWTEPSLLVKAWREIRIAYKLRFRNEPTETFRLGVCVYEIKTSDKLGMYLLGMIKTSEEASYFLLKRDSVTCVFDMATRRVW